MKSLNPHQQKPTQTDTKQHYADIQKHDALMVSLWTRLQALYGSQWEKSHGELGGKTFNEWKGALTKFKPEQVKRGLQAIVDEASEYPPNLIKFLRLCRTVYPYENTGTPELPRPKPRYSVMRIERAKQQLLTGQMFNIPNSAKNKQVMDWCQEDEDLLCDLLAQWNPDTGHEGLNALIDDVQFSHGSQRRNTNAV
jgi:hypothetical protein